MDIDSDDDEQSQYPDGISQYPYFHTADPALAAAYAYGDPSGGSIYPDPIALYGGSVAPRSRSLSQIRYENDEEQGDEDEADEDDEEAFEHDLALSQALADAREPRIDPDYDTALDAGAEEAASDDDFEASDDEATRGRGRRGRGEAGWGRRYCPTRC